MAPVPPQSLLFEEARMGPCPASGPGRLLDWDAIVSEYSDERAVSVADVEQGVFPRLMETAAVSSTLRALGVGAGGKGP